MMVLHNEVKEESLGSFGWHNTKGSKHIFVFSLHKSHFITKSCPGRHSLGSRSQEFKTVRGIILGQLPGKGGGGLEHRAVSALA